MLMEWKHKLDECCADELEEMIMNYIKAGFLSDEEIIEDCEEYIEEEYPDDSGNISTEDFCEIMKALRGEYQNTGNQENFLRLDSAFKKLEEQGIVSLHCAGYTQSDGFDDCNEIAAERHGNGEKIIGCCFYTMQDLERILHEERALLYFSYGNYFDKPTAVEVGQKIAEELGAAGFSVQWDGSADSKIAIKDMKWDKYYCLEA